MSEFKAKLWDAFFEGFCNLGATARNILNVFCPFRMDSYILELSKIIVCKFIDQYQPKEQSTERTVELLACTFCSFADSSLVFER